MSLCYTCQSFGIWGSETPVLCGLLDAQKPGPSCFHRGTSRDNLLTHLDLFPFATLLPKLTSHSLISSASDKDVDNQQLLSVRHLCHELSGHFSFDSFFFFF